jgi:DNA-3-methyladenine glycosylase II
MSKNRRDEWSLGVQHLSQVDRVLAKIIVVAAPFELKLPRNRFWTLVSSIVSQQLSTASARTIRTRLEQLLDGGLAAEAILQQSEEKLRSIGLSKQKASYIQDLAAKVVAGDLDLSNMGRKSDEAIIAELTEVRGIGRWTAQMFLIFALGRLDVFPYDDLGVRAAIRNLYGLSDLPTRRQADEIALPWRPYASIASWYCWRSLE